MTVHITSFVVSLRTSNGDMRGCIHEGVWYTHRCIRQLRHLLCTRE